ncbi:response regulator transcription factor [Cellulophaga sp. E16_2]|uniref:Response regulator receiver protein n=1 Tax=Cellulophaga algicola (strain DSM 14237 / IC166 / ACAM 630) TaxID=688270 RepID=E6XEX1_CELAD|nr:response regulator transcription factor [Cellulophaga sp. E16_2]ADV48173.1 response regulator receiver protein [Cellulophaga algicola DSM 14237]MBO0590598.1 response regulator transcription factor [Cellulophaga sp. E16_2]
MQLDRIFVSEDIDSNNLGVTTTLQNMGYTQIGHSQYCDDALLKLQKAILDGNPYDLLITDLSFENPRSKKKLQNGQELIVAIKAIQPTLKVIVFSVEDDHHTITTLFSDQKIDAYVCKGLNGLSELQKSIKAITKHEQYTCPIATAVLQQKNVLALDDYDQQLLSYLSKGYTQLEISTLLKEKGISPNSVRSIEGNISKLKDYFNATNTTHLVYVASSLGLI